MGCHPHSYGLGLSASFASAAAARVGGFPLLAVLVYVADEHPAIYARAGTQPLEARVVRLYGVVVVVILGGWARTRCARLFGVHKTSLWAGLRGAPTPAGPFLY